MCAATGARSPSLIAFSNMFRDSLATSGRPAYPTFTCVERCPWCRVKTAKHKSKVRDDCPMGIIMRSTPSVGSGAAGFLRPEESAHQRGAPLVGR